MAVIRIRTTVPPNRRLVIDLPPDTPEGEVEVEVRASVTTNGGTPSEHISDFLERMWAEQRADPNWTPRSKEDIDRQVESERSSWE